jgi:hypothetical protein
VRKITQPVTSCVPQQRVRGMCAREEQKINKKTKKLVVNIKGKVEGSRTLRPVGFERAPALCGCLLQKV